MTLASVQAAAATLEALPLSGPTGGERSKADIDAVVAAQLTAKAKALFTLEKLTMAVDAADPQRLDALALYAACLEHFAADLRRAYVPSYLTREEREQYQLELAERARPLLQKALRVWQLVLDASGSPDRASTHAQAAVAILRLQATSASPAEGGR